MPLRTFNISEMRLGPMKTTAIALGVGLGLGVAYLAFGFWFGPIVTPDSLAYRSMAQALATLHYSPLRYLLDARNTADGLGGMPGTSHTVLVQFYLTYIYVFAAAEAGFGPHWPQALVVLNAVAYAATGALVLLMLGQAQAGTLALWVAVAFLMSLFDFYQWVAMTQSDPLFILLSTAAVLLALWGCREGPTPTRTAAWSGTAVMLAAAALCRPAWPPVALAVAAVAVGAWAYNAPTEGAARLRYTWICALGMVLVAVGLAAGIALLWNPQMLPPGALRDVATAYGAEVGSGAVVFQRPETYLRPNASIAGYTRVVLARAGYCFWFLADGYSPAHRLMTVAAHVPLYLLAVVGAATTLRGNSRFAAAAGFASIAWIVATALYHALTLLDFDWRYRAPTYPALIFLAAMGASRAWKSAISHLPAVVPRTVKAALRTPDAKA